MAYVKVVKKPKKKASKPVNPPKGKSTAGSLRGKDKKALMKELGL